MGPKRHRSKRSKSFVILVLIGTKKKLIDGSWGASLIRDIPIWRKNFMSSDLKDLGKAILIACKLIKLE